MGRGITLWAQISADADNMEPNTLRSLLIYGGASITIPLHADHQGGTPPRSKLPRTPLTLGYRSSCFCRAKTAHQNAWFDWDGLWILMMKADSSLYYLEGKNRITTPLLHLKVRSSLSVALPHGQP